MIAHLSWKVLQGTNLPLERFIKRPVLLEPSFFQKGFKKETVLLFFSITPSIM